MNVRNTLFYFITSSLNTRLLVYAALINFFNVKKIFKYY